MGHCDPSTYSSNLKFFAFFQVEKIKYKLETVSSSRHPSHLYVKKIKDVKNKYTRNLKRALSSTSLFSTNVGYLNKCTMTAQCRSQREKESWYSLHKASRAKGVAACISALICILQTIAIDRDE